MEGTASSRFFIWEGHAGTHYFFPTTNRGTRAWHGRSNFDRDSHWGRLGLSLFLIRENKQKREQTGVCVCVCLCAKVLCGSFQSFASREMCDQPPVAQWRPFCLLGQGFPFKSTNQKKDALFFPWKSTGHLRVTPGSSPPLSNWPP